MLRQFVVVLAASLPLAAQVADTLPLVRAEVIAVDAGGNRVRGLSPADFEIVENGQRRGIVEFTEHSSSAASIPAVTDTNYVPLTAVASPPPPRRLTVVFADEITAAEREAAMALVQRHTRDGDVVSVAEGHSLEARLASAVLQLARHPEKKGIVLYGQASDAALAFARRRGVSVVKPEELDDLASFYSLAFRGRDTAAIQIKTSRPFTLRTALTGEATSAEQAIGDTVLLHHLIPPRSNELKIAAAADPVAASDAKRSVKLNVLIPIRRLTLAREGDNVTGGFDVYVSLGDGKGGFAAPSKQTHVIKWPAAALEQAGDRVMNYTIDVILGAETSRISVGVLDHRSKKTGFTRVEVNG